MVDDGLSSAGPSNAWTVARQLVAYIATEKARTSALGRRESKGMEEMVNGGRNGFPVWAPLVTSLEGGVPIVVEGQVMGAVGVSGVKADQDAHRLPQPASEP